jgi:hypothetical protein
MRLSDQMQTENIDLVFHTGMPQLTGVEPNAMIDRTLIVATHPVVMEGWATWNRNVKKTLHVYVADGSQNMSAYAFERFDLSDRAGAKGFLLVAENSRAPIEPICVMILSGNNFYSLTGSAC